MMKAFSLRITEGDFLNLKHDLLSADGNENAAALLCGKSETSKEATLLVRGILHAEQDDYIVREPYRLEVSPRFYNRLISECLSHHLNPAIIHSHPGSQSAWFSKSDDYGDSRLLPVLEALIPGSISASLVLTPHAVAARYFAKGEFHSFQNLTVSGLRTNIFELNTTGNIAGESAPIFDRQVRAFGTQGQTVLSKLKVAIVGVGGTGSLVAEQLARAGVNDFFIIDPDTIEESNVARMFGSSRKDISRKKAEVVSSHLSRLGASNVKALCDNAIRQPVLLALRDRQIIFGCVDNDRTRSILARFAYQYLIPFIDVGIRLDARTGKIRSAAGRVSVVTSGGVCLRCSHHINTERIRAESLPPEERKKLEREGYIMGVDEPAPAVVTLNTVIAGLAATAGVNVFVNLTGERQASDQLYDASFGQVFRARDIHESGCDICDETVGVKALGDKQIVSAYE